ncbi:hypothetical protein DSO57_1005394 [Entomophthora muscae]|uniref:Uncharacterized protein n=1 Tax=Entomophthora muscae TaxID=34485 RepID=A0ACC2RZ11_9FUNG|nr:hypothetical protein DSO57_1005394 [Entomophthora muscae]
MSTPSCPSAAPPGLSPTTVVTTCNSQAAFKFWASQTVGTFSGKGFRAWFYYFEDYCDTFSLLDAARLKEVGSKLCYDAHIWHQDMLFDTWEEWKVEAKKKFIGHKPEPQHLLIQIKISQFSALQPFIVKFQEYTNKVLV